MSKENQRTRTRNRNLPLRISSTLSRLYAKSWGLPQGRTHWLESLAQPSRQMSVNFFIHLTTAEYTLPLLNLALLLGWDVITFRRPLSSLGSAAYATLSLNFIVFSI